MLPIRIAIASRSASVGLADLTTAAAAINLQINRDLMPIWNISATVAALADPDSVPPGVWPVYIVDDTGYDGAAGIHLTQLNQPYALVDAGPTWTLTASHECLEMIVDPSGNRLVSAPAIMLDDDRTDMLDHPSAKFEYLVEVADPSEDQTNAYYIDGVLVSDFYTPRFFDPAAAGGVRYSFSGKIMRPRQVLQGGYLSWLDPLRQQLQQLRWLDTLEIVDIPGHVQQSGRATLRGMVDRFAGTRGTRGLRMPRRSARAPMDCRKPSPWRRCASRPTRHSRCSTPMWRRCG